MKVLEEKQIRILNGIALMCAALVSGLGFVALLGWLLNLPLLASFGPTLIPMAPITALLFLLYGTLIVAGGRLPLNRRLHQVTVIAGSLGLALSVFLMFSSFTGIHVHVEHLWFSSAGKFDGVPTGRMSPVTALCFVVIALSYLSLQSVTADRLWPARGAMWLASAVIVASLALLLAYLFGSPMFYRSETIPPALSTSLAFILLALGLHVRAASQKWLFRIAATATSAREWYILIMVFVLLASGIVTAGYVYFKEYENQFELGVERQLSSVGRLKSEELVRWRNERLGDGRIFFKNEMFSGIVEQFFQNPNDRDARTEVRTWVGRVQEARDYDAAILLDAQLRTRLVVPENKKPPLFVIDPKTRERVLSGNIAFQDFYRNDQNDRVYLGVLVPILEKGLPGRLIGVLAMVIDPEQYLYPMINRWPVPSSTSETLLLRREGNGVLFLNEHRLQKNSALNVHAPLSNVRQPAVMAALGKEGIVEGSDSRGVSVIADVRPIPDSPWFMVSRMEVLEVYAPLREHLWEMVGLVGVLLIAAAAGVGGVRRHQHARFYRQQFEAAELLHASELRYRRLFEAAKDGILILDANTGTVVDVNPYLIELLGFSRDEFLRKKIWDLGFFKDIAESKANFLELQEKRYIRYKDLPLKTAKGKQINVEFVSNVYQVDHQSVAQCNIRDITERKRTEAVLHESEERYRQLVEMSPDAIAIHAEGKFVYVNPAGLSLIGAQDPKELIGKPVLDIIHPDSQSKVIERLRRMSHNERAPLTEEKFIRLDGTVIDVEVAATSFEYEGKPAGQVIARNITERKRAEAALRDSEKEFRLLAEAMPQIVWITRPDGWNIYFNRQWMEYTGQTLEESYGHGWNTPFHPDDRQRAWDAWQNATRNGASYLLECRLRRADGVYTWWLIRGVPIVDAHGTVLKWFGTCTDINEIKQAEEEIRKLNAGLEERVLERTAQLEGANKELEAFSYSVSHDLRAPLRAIDGFSQIILDEYANKLDAEGNRLLNIIRSNTQKMGELISDLLNLSRVSRNEMNMSRVAMATLAQSIYYEAASPEIRAGFSFSVAPVPDAYCDPSLMRQVWMNLISNAIKFTMPKNVRTIEIGGHAENGKVIYFIKDSGVGFDPRYTHKLFGVFQRLHTADKFEGTGVGLAIVQRIIHRHGGKVWAEGKVGEGATFWFSIPNKES